MQGTVNVGQAQNDMSGYVSSSQVGVPGGIATLNANGKLTASQVPDIDHYTQAQTDSAISTAVSAHNSNASAHSDIRQTISDLQAAVEALELKYDTDITDNAFTVTFGDLSAVTVTGVWNATLGRIEF